MPRTIKFHLDENVHGAIADGLRRRGIDVTTTTDARLIGADDSQQLAFALRENRVLFTHDEDFLKVHSAGTDHAGIVYSPQCGESIGGIIRTLELLWDDYESSEMRNTVEFI